MSFKCPFPNRSCFLKFLENLRPYVERKVREMLSLSQALEKESFPEEPLTLIVKAIVTQSWRFKGSWKRFVETMKERSYDKWHTKSKEVKCQQTDSVEVEPLIGLEDLSCVHKVLLYLHKRTGKEPWRDKAKAVEALEEKLRSSGSLRLWVSELYKAIPKGFLYGEKPECLKGVKGIGLKGACDIVRTLGYFDVAPIDIHEKRFLLRTGIVCRYGPASFDPRNEISYLIALRNFCREELSGEKILGIDLGEAPGIVDVAIWCFCSEEEEGMNICGNEPSCDECPLCSCCLYYFLTHPV